MTSIPFAGTPRQEAFIRRLLAERVDEDGAPLAETIAADYAVDHPGATLDDWLSALPHSAISRTIDALMQAPEGAPRPGTPRRGRPNRFEGDCGDCGGTVDAGAGVIARVNGRWVAYHVECPAADHPHTDTPSPVEIPEGHYATPSRTGSNDLDFWRVDRPTEGRWAGRVFVRRMIGGRGAERVRGAEQRQALAAIAEAGIDKAARQYGVEIGRCYRCNRLLTDETSRSLGIGPDCRRRS